MVSNKVMPICIGRERSVHNCIRHRTTLRGLEKKKLSIQYASALISQRIRKIPRRKIRRKATCL